jgi:hypothetical protein
MSATAKPHPKIIVCSTPTCSFCNAAKHYFFDGIDYLLMDHGDILARVN